MNLTKRATEWNPADIIGDLTKRQEGEGVLKNVDARVLLPGAFIVILALSAVTRWYVPAAVFIVVLCITLSGITSRKNYLQMLTFGSLWIHSGPYSDMANLRPRDCLWVVVRDACARLYFCSAFARGV